MMSAAIARSCGAGGVSCVIICVLSENADGCASANFAGFADEYSEPVTAELAVRMIERIGAGRGNGD
jgi:nucleoside phosphorylase